jgi:hypothetical protein
VVEIIQLQLLSCSRINGLSAGNQRCIIFITTASAAARTAAARTAAAVLLFTVLWGSQKQLC